MTYRQTAKMETKVPTDKNVNCCIFHCVLDNSQCLCTRIWCMYAPIMQLHPLDWCARTSKSQRAEGTINRRKYLCDFAIVCAADTQGMANNNIVLCSL